MSAFIKTTSKRLAFGAMMLGADGEFERVCHPTAVFWRGN